jgi:hypothetical protein
MFMAVVVFGVGFALLRVGFGKKPVHEATQTADWII